MRIIAVHKRTVQIHDYHSAAPVCLGLKAMAEAALTSMNVFQATTTAMIGQTVQTWLQVLRVTAALVLLETEHIAQMWMNVRQIRLPVTPVHLATTLWAVFRVGASVDSQGAVLIVLISMNAC